MSESQLNASCVITGGAGFIGTSIIDGMRRRYSNVVVVDCMHPQIHQSQERPTTLPGDVSFVYGDIADDKTWEEVTSIAPVPQTIIHLAAETGTGQSLTEASRHCLTNVYGTAKMLDVLAKIKSPVSQIILASSRAIYGEGAWVGPNGDVFYPSQRDIEQLTRGQWDFPNGSPLANKASITRPAPVSIYATTKLAQEHLLSSWGTAFGVNVTILRLQNVYGPGQSLINSYTGILPLFCRIARKKESIPVYEDGQMLRDFIFIDDVRDSILAANDCNLHGVSVFDVGSGKSISIYEVAEYIAKHYGAPPPHICSRFRHGDVRHAVCDSRAVQKELHWHPRWEIEAGLSALITWVDKSLAES